MRRLRTVRTCREAENPPVLVTLVDENAAQSDALVVTSGGVIGIALSDSNAAQNDELDVSMSFAISDSNDPQTDAVDPDVVAISADSNATTTDALAAKLSAIMADFNATQNDSIVASVRASIPDSNATQNDALAVSLVGTFPPTGALYAWRADLGVTGGPTPITSWTDQVAGKVATANGWNQANDANFNNQKSLQSTGLASFLSISNISPAISPPYWFFFVARNLNTNTISAIWDQGPTTTRLFFAGGVSPNGRINMVTNSNTLSSIIDSQVPTVSGVFVGGLAQTSKIFYNAQTPVATQPNIFADGTIVNNSNATIGNRVFDDQAVTTVVEFGIADNTFNISTYLAYAGVRYGIPIGP